MTQDRIQNRAFTMVLPGGRVPARFVTLEDGTPGVEVEGVTFPHVTDEVPHGIKGNTDEQRRVVDELRLRFRITSEPTVFAFEVE
ncbi:hypothetical protein [Deinococcus hopiensis]|uniref:Uncharacterized protein n=1 Tax=Deinococcus hopiensis KR-140 TaxID=695939 RepID=A0A1W1VDK4_9DEIO|nr:hypothetical protein [Deinococcus hopiensis]SMB91121.1 hypothetical protein SAMN00790413_00994 [Deinococcus hopiensis KR-140]